MKARGRYSIQTVSREGDGTDWLSVSRPESHKFAHSLTLVFRSTHSWHDSVGLFRFCFFLAGPLS